MKKEILSLLLIIMFVGMVSADIRITLNTPQATFRPNYGEVVNYHIEVENKNTFPVNVSLVPENLDIGFQSSTTFSLQPNEVKDINYSINIKQTGNYSRSISVTYKGNGEVFAVQQTLFFLVPLRGGVLECDTLGYECPGGTTVYKNANNNCEFAICPLDSATDISTTTTTTTTTDTTTQTTTDGTVYNVTADEDTVPETSVVFTTQSNDTEEVTGTESVPKPSIWAKVLIVVIVILFVALIAILIIIIKGRKTREENVMTKNLEPLSPGEIKSLRKDDTLKQMKGGKKE